MGKQRNAYDDKCTREGCWGYCQTLTEEARRRRSREARMTVVPLMTTRGTLCKTRLGMEEIIKSLSSSVARHSHLSLKRKKKGKKKNLSNFLRRGTLPSLELGIFFSLGVLELKPFKSTVRMCICEGIAPSTARKASTPIHHIE